MSKRGRPSNLTDPENNAWCSKCQKEKPKDDFYGNSSRSNGLDSRCKKCNHANKRKRNKEKQKDGNEWKWEDLDFSPLPSDDNSWLMERLKQTHLLSYIYHVSSDELDDSSFSHGYIVE